MAPSSVVPIQSARLVPPADASPCGGNCASTDKLPFGFEFAYQPIVDLAKRELWGHEALVRGPQGESALSVLGQVNNDNRYRFDQLCRIKAIRTAAELELDAYLSINFLPNAVYRPEVCIRTTLEAARAHGFPIQRIVFESTEGEHVGDKRWYADVMREYQRIGFLTAIDDFGAGYAGLSLLADFVPDLLKLDMVLVRGIQTDPTRQAIVRHLMRLCEELDTRVIAEGIETAAERDTLADLGVTLMQGWLFARPAFRALVPAEQLQGLPAPRG